jgi:hypothetical protein
MRSKSSLRLAAAVAALAVLVSCGNGGDDPSAAGTVWVPATVPAGLHVTQAIAVPVRLAGPQTTVWMVTDPDGSTDTAVAVLSPDPSRPVTDVGQSAPGAMGDLSAHVRIEPDGSRVAVASRELGPNELEQRLASVTVTDGEPSLGDGWPDGTELADTGVLAPFLDVSGSLAGPGEGYAVTFTAETAGSIVVISQRDDPAYATALEWFLGPGQHTVGIPGATTHSLPVGSIGGGADPERDSGIVQVVTWVTDGTRVIVDARYVPSETIAALIEALHATEAAGFTAWLDGHGLTITSPMPANAPVTIDGGGSDGEFTGEGTPLDPPTDAPAPGRQDGP